MNVILFFASFIGYAMLLIFTSQVNNAIPGIRLASMVEGDYLLIKAVNPSCKPPKKLLPGHGESAKRKLKKKVPCVATDPSFDFVWVRTSARAPLEHFMGQAI